MLLWLIKIVIYKNFYLEKYYIIIKDFVNEFSELNDLIPTELKYFLKKQDSTILFVKVEIILF